MRRVSSQKSTCPVTTVAELLPDAWTILIIHNLLDFKSMRFCELERELDGISTRTLALKLKTLEKKSIIIKSEHAGYSLTKGGRDLKPIIKAMANFGKRFKVKLKSK